MLQEEQRPGRSLALSPPLGLPLVPPSGRTSQRGAGHRASEMRFERPSLCITGERVERREMGSWEPVEKHPASVLHSRSGLCTHSRLQAWSVGVCLVSSFQVWLALLIFPSLALFPSFLPLFLYSFFFNLLSFFVLSLCFCWVSIYVRVWLYKMIRKSSLKGKTFGCV